jgi:hypothetical protein
MDAAVREMTLDKGRNARQITAVRGTRELGALLPFSKRKNTGEEMELDDDDLVLVEDPASAPSLLRSPASLASRLPSDAPAGPRPRKMTPAGSRRIVDEATEEDVAGECLRDLRERGPQDAGLVSIAADTRDFHSSSHVRAAPARPAPSVPPPGATQTRLPVVSAPPFVRTATTIVPLRREGDAAGGRESSPPPAFVRRSSPMIAIASSAPVIRPGSSVTPHVSERTPEPTVIVVRERPKAGWVIGAGVIGALFALGATRLFATSPPDTAAATTVVAAAAAPPAAAPLPPSSVLVTPAPAAAQPAAVMRFNDDQGVAITAAPRAPAATTAVVAAKPAPPRPAPRASAVGPALPDGTFGLGRNESAAPMTPAVHAAAPSPAPAETAKKPRALTPEQELAEAQLKASMR